METKEATETKQAACSIDTPSQEVEEESAGVSTINENRLLLKIDIRLLPPLCIIYLCAFLDRINLGHAQIFGLSEELGLEGNQYNVAIFIFFIGYILLEIPSNALLKHLTPSVFLSGCIFMFGIITIGIGFVQSYGALLATRVLLGCFEAGILPGCLYLISMWYIRRDSQKRFTLLLFSSALAGAFGGFVATGIGNIDPVSSGKRQWRWLFIIEGAATSAIAIAAYFLIPGFPEDVTWLTPEEKSWLHQRLVKDVGESGRNKRSMQLKDLKILWTDYKFITGGLLNISPLIGAYGFSFFAPMIIQQQWKASASMTQLLTVPVWASAWLVSMAVSIISDRIRHRFFFIMGLGSIGAVGLIILLSTSNPRLGYAALFLYLIGLFSPAPLCLNWLTTNLAGHNRRAIGSAFQVAFANMGGLIAPFIYIKKEAPRYPTGFGFSLGTVILMLVCTVIMYFGFRRENRLREKGLAGIEVGEESDEVVGDLARSYRYML